MTSVWSGPVGFNPVTLVFEEGEKPGGPVRRSTSWTWHLVDGVFLPAIVSEVQRDADAGNIDTYKRISELKECSLNKPLDAGQFEYAALGLSDGDIVLDDLNRTVFVMNGQEPTKLAEYHERYVPPGTPSLPSGIRFWLVVGNIAVVALMLAVFWIRRVRRRV